MPGGRGANGGVPGGTPVVEVPPVVVLVPPVVVVEAAPDDAAPEVDAGTLPETSGRGDSRVRPEDPEFLGLPPHAAIETSNAKTTTATNPERERITRTGAPR